MSTALAKKSDFLDADQVALIKRTICPDATDDELKLFVNTAQRLGLDPFARQIFAVKRWNSQQRREVMAIQVAIDGFRLIAERTGDYEGQIGPQWCGADAVWRDVWVSDVAPFAARVGVWRKGFREPLYSVARFDAYAQTKKGGGLNRMWAKMGDLMIAKCAEALALRRAFPSDLSGVYSPDEMGQADNVEVVTTNDPPDKPQPRVIDMEIAPAAEPLPDASKDEILSAIKNLLARHVPDAADRTKQLKHLFGAATKKAVEALDQDILEAGYQDLLERFAPLPKEPEWMQTKATP